MRMTIGKYKGWPLERIPKDYLIWFYESGQGCWDYNNVVNEIVKILDDPKYPPKLRIVDKNYGQHLKECRHKHNKVIKKYGRKS